MLDSTEQSAGDPPWMRVALGEIDVRELPGRRHNPRILEYHRTTGLSAENDETSWCSAFVNWCLRQAGIAGTDSAAARSWLNWGDPLEQPRRGAIAVLWRVKPQGWQGHVGFLDRIGHIDGRGHVWLLGGNQGDRVSIASFPLTRLLGYRWPPEIPRSQPQRKE
jgi:uncharacterized protein (TIGR02594 family)